MSEKPRTVLITGGSRGLGAGIVRSFLADGDAVATCSRSATPETDGWTGSSATASTTRPSSSATATPAPSSSRTCSSASVRSTS